MNILLINHYAGSPQHGMEYRPYYLAREWVRMGHRVQIVASSYSHIRTQQPDLAGRKELNEVLDGIAYRWYRTPSYHENGLGRVKNIGSFLWKIRHDAKRIAHEFKPDVVIASSTYPMDIWPARRIARLAQAKLVFEVHDLWPLSPMELGGMSKWHPFIMWVQAAEDYAYRHADKVISMLPKAMGYMVSRGLSEEKFVYVPNGVVEEEWADQEPLPGAVANELQKLRGQELPILCYAGTHGLANALDVLLDAAHHLQGKVYVLLVGTGPERERLQRRVVKEGLANVVMIAAIPKRAIPSLLAEIDIAYIGLLPQPLFRFGISPNKLMDYMMASKPVIQAVSAGNDPVGEARCGYTVPPGEPEAIRDAVLKILTLSEEARREMGVNGRKLVLSKQTYPVLARDFLNAVY